MVINTKGGYFNKRESAAGLLSRLAAAAAAVLELARSDPGRERRLFGVRW